jgi:hypothetical protein
VRLRALREGQECQVEDWEDGRGSRRGLTFMPGISMVPIRCRFVKQARNPWGGNGQSAPAALISRDLPAAWLAAISCSCNRESALRGFALAIKCASPQWLVASQVLQCLARVDLS